MKLVGVVFGHCLRRPGRRFCFDPLGSAVYKTSSRGEPCSAPKEELTRWIGKLQLLQGTLRSENRLVGRVIQLWQGFEAFSGGGMLLDRFGDSAGLMMFDWFQVNP